MSEVVDNTKRAVLDTSIVRNLAHLDTQPKVLAALGVLRASSFTLHLSELALAELTNQLWREQVTWAEWEEIKKWLPSLLDERSPVLLGGIRWLATKLVDPPQELLTPSPGELRLEMAAGWRHLLAAQSRADIERPLMFLKGGKLFELTTDARNIGSHLQVDREAWLDDFAHVLHVAKATDVSDELAEVLPAEEAEEVFRGVVEQGRRKGDHWFSDSCNAAGRNASRAPPFARDEPRRLQRLLPDVEASPKRRFGLLALAVPWPTRDRVHLGR